MKYIILIEDVLLNISSREKTMLNQNKHMDFLKTCPILQGRKIRYFYLYSLYIKHHFGKRVLFLSMTDIDLWLHYYFTSIIYGKKGSFLFKKCPYMQMKGQVVLL